MPSAVTNYCICVAPKLLYVIKILVKAIKVKTARQARKYPTGIMPVRSKKRQSQKSVGNRNWEATENSQIMAYMSIVVTTYAPPCILSATLSSGCSRVFYVLTFRKKHERVKNRSNREGKARVQIREMKIILSGGAARVQFEQNFNRRYSWRRAATASVRTYFPVRSIASVRLRPAACSGKKSRNRAQSSPPRARHARWSRYLRQPGGECDSRGLSFPDFVMTFSSVSSVQRCRAAVY